jgi:hypothetical protein
MNIRDLFKPPARLVSALAAGLLGVSASICAGAGLPSGKAHAIGAATKTAVGTGLVAGPVPTPYGLAMSISPVGSAIKSGQPLVLRLILRNRGRTPLKLFLDTWGSILTRFSVVGPAPRSGLCPLSRLGRHPAWRYPSFVSGHWVMHARLGGGIVTGLAPGKSVVFLSRYVVPPFFDMTVPGDYRVQVGCAGMVSNVATVRVSADGTKPPTKPLISGPLKAAPGTVGGPPGPHFHGALLPGTPRAAVRWGKPWRGLEVRVFQAAPGGTTVGVVLRNVGKTRVHIGLTGAPAQDFPEIAATGPNAGFLISGGLAPRLVDFRNKPVPSSAYGAYLAASGPVRTLKRATYNLAPGKEYWYAGQVTIGSRVDMSLPGKYRVKLRLAGTRCWSNVAVLP